ncbi:MAG: DNA alkylation repair protein [Gammaproteobacteria bacterium]
MIADDIAAFVAAELESRADPMKATPMAAYMKTTMPFYGVQAAAQKEIARAAAKRFDLTSQRDYERTINELWSRPHREERYLAIRIARLYPELVTPRVLKLYEKLIRDGAWWDLVDDIAIHLAGKVLLEHRAKVVPLMDDWISDDNMWIRRSAIISQIGHKQNTDYRRLFAYCRARAFETEFFIRKAIGWGLRDYSYTAPGRVVTFLNDNADSLSGLSFREAAKGLRRMGFCI